MVNKRKATATSPERADKLVSLFDGFDYRVESGDFLLYEIGRLIEEDKVSLEEEFRRVIDEGIRQHVEERTQIRAQLAGRLRAAYAAMEPAIQPLARRVIGAIEDVEQPLRGIASIVRSYTAYLFRILQEAADESSERMEEARSWIERWRNGEAQPEDVTERLTKLGISAAGPAADLLFDSLDDQLTGRPAAEMAIALLGGIQSSVSARVLAHAISEPMLDEELELKAYTLLRTLWPLPRNYILSMLSSHTHEDLPFRWFQLLIQANEIYAVDLILEELEIHGDDSAFREDLVALVTLLRESGDPETEDKVLQFLNNPDAPRPAIALLQDYLRESRPPLPPVPDHPWSRLSHMRRTNQRYIEAARSFDAGRKEEAARKIDEVLKDEPQYPFAVMLKKLI